jgi:hypothetical protein
MPEYRKSKSSDTWHWVRQCSKWPTYDYDVMRVKPQYDKFCEECKQKETPEDLE